jgi:phosphate transport system permease protein
MGTRSLSARRRLYDRTLRALLYLSGVITCALLVLIIGYIFYRGVPHVTWQLLSTQTSYLNDTIGILPNILNTLYLVLLAMVIVLPLGVGAAIYLTEYATNRRLVAVIEFATETLTGIPSIIFGLVGMLFFIQLFGLKTGVLAGSLTLVVMILPTIVRTTQESLKTVPQSYREGALALGAGKWHWSAPWCCRAPWTASSPAASWRWGASWANPPLCCIPPASVWCSNDFVTSLQAASGSLTVALYMYSEGGETAVGFAIATI